MVFSFRFKTSKRVCKVKGWINIWTLTRGSKRERRKVNTPEARMANAEQLHTEMMRLYFSQITGWHHIILNLLLYSRHFVSWTEIPLFWIPIFLKVYFRYMLPSINFRNSFLEICLKLCHIWMSIDKIIHLVKIKIIELNKLWLYN